MHCIGRLHFKGQVGPLGVIDRHRLGHHLPGLRQVPGPMQQEFAFQDPVYPFCQRILVAVVAVGHRADHAVLSVDLLVIVRAVLDTAVGVVDQPLARFSTFQRDQQRLGNLLGLQRVMHAPPHDFPRPRICNQAQIHEFPLRRQIGDVGYPHLFAASGHYAPIASLEQVGVTPEAVMAVGCLVIRPPHRNQEPGITKNAKQAVPPHRDPRCLQCWSDQTVELAGADTGLTRPMATH